MSKFTVTYDETNVTETYEYSRDVTHEVYELYYEELTNLVKREVSLDESTVEYTLKSEEVLRRRIDNEDSEYMNLLRKLREIISTVE